MSFGYELFQRLWNGVEAGMPLPQELAKPGGLAFPVEGASLLRLSSASGTGPKQGGLFEEQPPPVA
jgi:hypothetical protein